MPSLRERVHAVLYPKGPPPALSRVVDGVVVAFILISTVQVVLESEAELRERYGSIFAAVELVTLTVFVVEYLARIW